MAAGGSTRTVLTALFANAGIAVAKFIGFMITRSTSMLTESVHSLADTSNQALLLLGGRQAKKAASLEHPFGYGRERYFWSFVVAMILFSLGGLFAIYEGWEKVQHPHELDAPIVAVVILVLGLGLEGYAFRTAKEEAERVKSPTTSWTRFIRRSRNPELPVVLLEDAGALLGLMIALIGVFGAWFIDPVLDGYATLAIGILLLAIAVVLAVEMKSLLIGEAALPEDRDRLIGAIEGHRDVHSLLHLRTQHIGPDELLVGAKVHFRPSLNTSSLAAAINETEAAMRAAVPIARVIYIEPDITNAPSATLGTLKTDDDGGAVADGREDDRQGGSTMPPPPTPASTRYPDEDQYFDGEDPADAGYSSYDPYDEDDAWSDRDAFGPDRRADSREREPRPDDGYDGDDSDDRGGAGDTNDGDTNEHDFNDGDTNDGDTNDGDTNDGDTNEHDFNDGDINDGDVDDHDPSDGGSNTAWSDAISDRADKGWAAQAGLDDDIAKDD